MKDQVTVAHIAKLDGWTGVQPCPVPRGSMMGVPPKCVGMQMCKEYLSSYDAIIPVIKKQSREVVIKMGEILQEIPWEITDVIHTPRQLGEALVKATKDKFPLDNPVD